MAVVLVVSLPPGGVVGVDRGSDLREKAKGGGWCIIYWDPPHSRNLYACTYKKEGERREREREGEVRLLEIGK